MGTGKPGPCHPIALSEAGLDPASLACVDAVMHSGLGRVFPAAVLHVRQAGAVVFERAYGYLDPETGRRPTQLDSLFDLASLTKLFTATAFMRLVEAGRVALETPVAEVLPEFAGTRPIGPTKDPLTRTVVPPDPQFAGQEVDRGTVTFWHLLTHTSGLAAWHSLYREDGGQETTAVPLPHQVPVPLRARRITAIYGQIGFAYPPGARVVYSDLGFILLGEAVARLAGVPLEVILRRAVLEPLGLRVTAYNPLANGFSPQQIVPTEYCVWRRRRCVGEVHDENSASLGGVAGHAGLFSTAAEVAALGQVYLDGGVYNGVRLLRPETVTAMVRVHAGGDTNPRGLGWLQRSSGTPSSVRRRSPDRGFGPRSFGHTGFTGTSLWVDPDRGLVVALLTNRVYYGRDPQPITDFRPRLHDAAVLKEKQRVIKLRPHHVLDIITAYGYDSEFKPHPYGHALHSVARAILSNVELKAKFIVGTDEICQPCKHLQPDGLCDDVLHQLDPPVAKQRYNDDLDLRLLAYLGLSSGTVMTMRHFLEVVDKKVPGIEELCTHPKEDQKLRLDGLTRGLLKLGIRGRFTR